MATRTERAGFAERPARRKLEALPARRAVRAPAFDDDTGIGFVDREVVRELFEWSDEQLAAAAPSIAFRYESVVACVAACSFVDSEGRRHEHRHDLAMRHGASVFCAVIGHVSGGTGRIEGFALSGLGHVEREGEIPQVGSRCTAIDAGVRRSARWSSVQLSLSQTQLYCSFDGDERAIVIG